MSNIWVKVAGVSGCLACVLGALGAHAMKTQSEPMKETWRVASQYHFIHTLALGMSALHFQGRKRGIVCGLFFGGILLFSGACYTVVYMNERQPYAKIAPFGGVMLMGGWLAIAFM